MTDGTTNPYESPRAPPPPPPVSVDAPASPAAVFVTPNLTVGCSLIIWLSLANALSDAVTAANVMYLWSLTLVASVTVSCLIMARFWPSRLSALSMALGFVVFGIVFSLLQDSPSSQTDPVDMVLLYGTLSILPVIVFCLTHWQNGRRAGRANNAVVNGAGPSD